MKKFILCLTIATTAFLAGCGGLTIGDNGFLRVAHLSPNTGNVNARIGSTQVSNISYGNATAYIQTGVGLPEVRVTVAGNSVPAIITSVPLSDGQSKTVIAGDRLANIRAIILTDDRSAPSGTNVRLRLVHAAPIAGNLDMHISAPNDTLSATTRVASNVGFAGNSGYVTRPAGVYRVRLTAPGTFNVTFDAGNISLTSGQVRTVVAADANGGGLPLQTFVLADRM